jgi:hypothetical protein
MTQQCCKILARAHVRVTIPQVAAVLDQAFVVTAPELGPRSFAELDPRALRGPACSKAPFAHGSRSLD